MLYISMMAFETISQPLLTTGIHGLNKIKLTIFKKAYLSKFCYFFFFCTWENFKNNSPYFIISQLSSFGKGGGGLTLYLKKKIIRMLCAKFG